MRRRIVVAPLIVVLGFVAFLFAQNIQANHETRMQLTNDILSVSQTPMAGVTYKTVSLSSLGIARWTSFDDVKFLLKNNGFVLLSEQQVLCVFGDTKPCEDLGGGSAVFQKASSQNTYVALKYDYKLGLKGCQPSIRNVVQAKFEKEIK